MRAVDERAAKADVTEAAVADLAGRVGGMEDSLAHLAQVRGCGALPITFTFSAGCSFLP